MEIIIQDNNITNSYLTRHAIEKEDCLERKTNNVRYLGDKLLEFKWVNGIRIYFTFNGKEIIILLNGGIKNAQKKDIEKAHRLCKKYT